MKTIISLLIVTFASLSASSGGSAVPYKVNGENFEGYFISPAPKAPLVLLVHDWDGLTDYEIKRAGMLAEEGYAVFAADLFGAGIRPSEQADRRQNTERLYKDRPRMRALLHGALEAAKSTGANIDKTVAVGYCFGGTAVLELARAGESLKGFVTFHGGLSAPADQNYENVKGRLLILHGTADQSVTMEDFAKLASELERKSIPHEMITYSGAPHAFSVFGSDRYREDADKKSWQRFLEFLNETLH